MDRPNLSYNDMLAVRVKYNKILENILAGKRNHYIMDMSNDVVHPWNFMYNNIINARGKDDMWHAVDHLIEEFDYRKENFLPIPSDQETSNQRQYQSQSYGSIVSTQRVAPEPRRENTVKYHTKFHRQRPGPR